MTNNEFLALNVGELDLVHVSVYGESVMGHASGIIVFPADYGCGGFYLYPGYSISRRLNNEQNKGKSFAVLFEYIKDICIKEKDYFLPMEDDHYDKICPGLPIGLTPWEYYGGEKGKKISKNLYRKFTG